MRYLRAKTLESVVPSTMAAAATVPIGTQDTEVAAEAEAEAGAEDAVAGTTEAAAGVVAEVGDETGAGHAVRATEAIHTIRDRGNDEIRRIAAAITTDMSAT